METKLTEVFCVTDERQAERMDAMLTVWLNNPLLDYEEIAEKAGIGVTTFWTYRQNTKFMEEYRKRNRARFTALEAKLIEKFEEKVDDGDWQAIKYGLDGLDYGAKTKIELETTKTIMVSIEE